MHDVWFLAVASDTVDVEDVNPGSTLQGQLMKPKTPLKTLEKSARTVQQMTWETGCVNSGE